MKIGILGVSIISFCYGIYGLFKDVPKYRKWKSDPVDDQEGAKLKKKVRDDVLCTVVSAVIAAACIIIVVLITK